MAGFGRVDLCLRVQVFCLRVVQFLLRNQAGTRGCRLLQAFRLGMERRVQCLGAFDLLLRARDFFLALFELECGLFELRFQLGNFEDRQRFSLVHDVADVDVDALHVAAHLGMHVDFLIGLELAGEREDVGNVAALGHGDARGGHWQKHPQWNQNCRNDRK